MITIDKICILNNNYYKVLMIMIKNSINRNVKMILKHKSLSIVKHLKEQLFQITLLILSINFVKINYLTYLLFF